MPHTIWHEPVGAVRSGAWYRQVWRRLTAGCARASFAGPRCKTAGFAEQTAGAAVYVIPDQMDVHEVVTRLLENGDSSVLGGDVVMSLRQWMLRLTEHAQPTAPLPIRLLAMTEALAQSTPRYFSAAQRTMGTARYLLAGMQTALAAGLDPSALRRCAEAFGAEREHDLATYARWYLEILHDAYDMIDPAEVALLAVAAVREHALPWQTVIVDVGLDPPAIVAPLLAAIHSQHPACALHTIVAAGPSLEAAGATTRDVSPEELLPAHTAVIELYRSASVVAEARWVVAQITQALQRGGDPAHIGLILLDANQAGLYHRMLIDAGVCAPHVAGGNPPDVLRRHFSCDSVWDNAPAAAPWSAWMSWLREQIERQYPREMFAARIRAGQHANLFIACAQELFAWQHAWTGLTARHAQSRTTMLTREHFRDLVTMSAPSHHDRQRLADAVPIQLYTFDALPARHLDVVFLPGAIEGQLPPLQRATFFPRLPAQADSTDLQPLRTAFPSAEHQQQSAARQWTRWLAMTDRLVVSYPEAALNGRPHFPSSLLRGTDAMPLACTAIATLAPPPTAQSAPTLHTVAERAARERALVARIAAGDTGVLLNDPAVVAHLKHRFANTVFSVTALQQFVTCPFRFFASTLLGITRPYADTPDLDHRTRGDWLHRALARVYQRHAAAWQRLGPAPDDTHREAIMQQARESLTATAAELDEALARHAPAFRAHALEQLTAMITDAVLADLAQWQQAGPQALHPTYFEWEFGMHDSPPCTLEDGDTTIAIRGKIDRIDINTPLRESLVIDYKTGKAESIIGELKAGQHLQLPLYLEAVRQLLQPPHQPIGALLFHLRAGERRHGLMRREIGKARFAITGRMGSSLTDEQWDTHMSTAILSAITAAQQIQAGVIPWQVHRCTQCDWRELSRDEERE